MTTERSTDRLWALIAGVVVAVVVTLAIGPWPVGVFQDDGMYVVLAKSLASGEGYRYLNLPGAPAGTHHPPLYPAFLAVLWKLSPAFPANVTLFKLANAAFLGLATGFTVIFARTRVRLGLAASVVTAVAFTGGAPVLLLAVMVLSEPMFLALLLPALLLTERVAEDGGTRRALVAAVLLTAVALVRTLGAFAIPAACLVLASRRRFRELVPMVVVPALGIGAWQLWMGMNAGELPPHLEGKYGSYGGWFLDGVAAEGPLWVARVAKHNASLLSAHVWELVAIDQRLPWLRWVATAAATGLFGFGLWRLARRAPVSATFVVATLAVIFVWPFAPPRLLWSLWPLVGCCFALGISGLWSIGAEHSATFAARLIGRALPNPARALRAVALGASVALGVGYAAFNVASAVHGSWTQVQRSVADRARPLAEWVAANTRPSDVVASEDELIVHLYTGRRTIPLGTFTPQEHLVPQRPEFATRTLGELLRTYDVRYVLASTNYGVYAASGLMRANPPELRLLTPLTVGAVFARDAAGTSHEQGYPP